ncbi:hypothetical protein Tco_0873060, partial [Tanacetum coccineum]
STEGSYDQQALETECLHLKDTITSLRIQLDGLKVDNVSLKRRYDDLSKANTHSRTAYTEKLNALTSENTKLKALVNGKTNSGPSTSETPKVLAPGMYNLGVKPATGTSKPVPKRDPRNHSTLPAKSEKAMRVEDHHRNLNKKNHVDSRLNDKHTGIALSSNNVCNVCNKCLVFVNHDKCVVRNLNSVKPMNVKTPKAKQDVNTKIPKAKHNVQTTKKVWKRKVVTHVTPIWKATGRYFALYDKYPLTRIVEPSDETLELSPSVSSSSKVTMISRFTDCKPCDQQSGSKGISGLFDY